VAGRCDIPKDQADACAAGWCVLVAAAVLAMSPDLARTMSRWPVSADGHPVASGPLADEPTVRAALLAAVLVVADDASTEVGRWFHGGCPPDELRRAARRAFVATLVHPQPARARHAQRQVGTWATSAWLLPELKRSFDSVTEPALRQVFADAHHRIGKAALAAPEPRAANPIRRSTQPGRLYRFDRMLAQLVRAVVTATGPDRLYGVDVAALRASTSDGSLRIRDEASSDGRTTVDLWHALAAAGGHGELLGGDRFIRYLLAETATAAGLLDAEGHCLQIEHADPIRAPFARPPSAQEAADLQGNGRTRPLRWMTPWAGDVPDGTAIRLRWRSQDVFVADPVPAHIIRVCGLLYRKVRADADAATYFDSDEIHHALRVLGGALFPGGVLMVGSVVDALDASTRFTDADVFQRVDRSGGASLHHCGRLGRGLGDEPARTLSLDPHVGEE
jgi:hypothetical protein